MSIHDFKIKEIDKISDVFKISYQISNDVRGNIYSTFHNDFFNSYKKSFKHDKFSKSRKNVLRGFHGDTKSTKLITCVYGEILQVVIDYRKESPTYLSSYSCNLSEGCGISLMIPPGVLNGYLVLSNEAIYHYKLSYDGEYIDAEDQISVKWNSSEIRFKWPIRNPILSDRDKIKDN